MKEIIIAENEAGQRLDKFLAKYLNEAPKSFYYKMLRKKNIVLNGKKADGSEKLITGDSVKFFLSDETIGKFSSNQIKKASAKLDIIYEDDHIMLINKPVGMLSQKADSNDVSLVEYLINYLIDSGQVTMESLRAFRPSVCNRLDRNTSGIVAAGKSLLGLQKMGELFQARSLQKYYRCLVKGQIPKGQYIKGYLKKDEHTNTVTVTKKEAEGSLPVETEYVPVALYKDCTLLEVHLITGRTHQIRSHLASVGHPVIGDYKYGSRKINDSFQESYGLKSQLLHAYRLEFPLLEGILSSLSGKSFTAPLPAVFRQILDEQMSEKVE